MVGRHKWVHLLVFVGLGAGVYIGDIAIPLLYRRLVDMVTIVSPSTESFKLALPILITVGLLILLRIAVYRVADFSLTFSQSRTLKYLSDYTFQKLVERSYKFFTDNFTGALTAKMKRFVYSFGTIHDQITLGLWMLIVSLVGVLVAVFNENILLGLVFLSWIIMYVLVTLAFVRHKLKYDLLTSEEDSKVTAKFSDAITNIITIKAFSSIRKEQIAFEKATEAQERARRRSWNWGNIQYLTQGILMGVLEFGGMYLAIKLWSEGEITFGTVVLLQIFIGSIFSKMWNLGRAIGGIFTAAANMKEMIDILDMQPEINDPEDPQPLKVKDGLVYFDNISFAYSDATDVQVFKDLRLEIPSGQKVGLVGSSGSGKTSLTKLLLRFFDIQQGVIYIDGQDISKVTQDDLRRAISYVPQEPLLFHRSLRDNIGYAKQGASIEEITEAAKSAKAHEFIQELPYGYDTLVGERGMKLSGGQRQRIAIARVLLEKAPILVLDEATSSLDSVSENFIQEALAIAMQGRTAIVIAHRLSTIMAMDRIIVLDKGQIVEDGTHQELLGKEGVYRNLWHHQNGGFLVEDKDNIDS